MTRVNVSGPNKNRMRKNRNKRFNINKFKTKLVAKRPTKKVTSKTEKPSE